MMPKDAPGGTKFIECLADAVKTLSLAYAGTPDDRVRPHLERYINSIACGIVEAVGAGQAPIWLNAFRRAVMDRKHKIETGSGSLSKGLS
jgi:hypothetical protein